jgi:hypothetical protein
MRNINKFNVRTEILTKSLVCKMVFEPKETNFGQKTKDRCQDTAKQNH